MHLGPKRRTEALPRARGPLSATLCHLLPHSTQQSLEGPPLWEGRREAVGDVFKKF